MILAVFKISGLFNKLCQKNHHHHLLEKMKVGYVSVPLQN